MKHESSFFLIAFYVTVLVLTVNTHGSYLFSDDLGWPRWRDPNGDGISQETDWNPEALSGEPKVLWKADIGKGHSNVVFRGTCLYTMTRKHTDGSVICLYAETG